MTGTGAGWADPYTRPIEAIQGDVKDGYVTVEIAEKNYGVILDPDTLEVSGITEERRQVSG